MLVRRGPKHAEELSGKVLADKYAAKWLDAAITMWGKATAYAEMIEVDLAHVTRMRSGEKPTPLRCLLPLLGNVEAVLAFVGPLLDSIDHHARPNKGLTEVELALIVLRGLNDGSAVTRKLIENLAAPFGHKPNEVAAALHEKEESK